MTARIEQDTIDFTKVGNIDVESIDVGYFADARYPDGTPVFEVAAYNEFGTSNIPERPAFRNAVRAIEDEGLSVIADIVAAAGVNLRADGAEQIGEYAKSEVQEHVTTLDQPPNAPSTIQRKGSSNPLIDTGFMRQSVSYEVNR